MSDLVMPAATASLRSRYWSLLAAVVIAGAGVRLFRLGALPLWSDELFSRFYPAAGEAFMWGDGLRLEPNPPLYYSLLDGWMGLAGSSEAAVRLPSVAGSVFAIVLAAALARELWGTERAGLAAAVLLALSPTSVVFAQEARAYALQSAALGLALLGAARFMRTAGQLPGRLPGRTTAQMGPLLLYAAGALTAIYLHLTSAIVVAAINLVVLAAALGRSRLVGGWAFGRWCLVNAGLMLCCLPLLPTLLSGETAQATAWIGPPSLVDAVYYFAALLAGPVLAAQFTATAPICAAMLVLLSSLRPWRADRRTGLVLVAVPLLSALLVVGISFIRPMLMLRVIAWMLVPAAAALAGIVAGARPGWAGGAARMLVITGLAGGLAVQVFANPDTKEDWRGFLGAIAPQVRPGSLLVVVPGTPGTAFAAYAPALGPLYGLSSGDETAIEGRVMQALMGIQPITPAVLARAVAAHRPVWLFSRFGATPWVQALLSTLPPVRERTDADGPPSPAAYRW